LEAERIGTRRRPIGRDFRLRCKLRRDTSAFVATSPRQDAAAKDAEGGIKSLELAFGRLRMERKLIGSDHGERLAIRDVA